MSLYERKFLALIQKRLGPVYVGYGGRLQLFADALKVLLKKNMSTRGTNQYYFNIVFNIYFLVNMALVFFLTYSPLLSFYSTLNPLLIYLIILSMSNVLLLATGLLSNNRYTNLAINRLVNMMFIGELFFVIMITSSVFILRGLSFHNLFILSECHPISYFTFVMIPTLYILTLFDTARAPFDLVESESEMIMGYTTEYSGFHFAGFVLVEYLHIYFFSYLFMILVFL